MQIRMQSPYLNTQWRVERGAHVYVFRFWLFGDFPRGSSIGECTVVSTLPSPVMPLTIHVNIFVFMIKNLRSTSCILLSIFMTALPPLTRNKSLSYFCELGSSLFLSTMTVYQCERWHLYSIDCALSICSLSKVLRRSMKSETNGTGFIWALFSLNISKRGREFEF